MYRLWKSKFSRFYFSDLLLLVFFLLIFEFSFIISSGLLVLLVLRHEVVHVGLGLSELHLVHALPGVPMKESLPPEHGSELFSNPLEELLDGGGVADEGGCHLETSGRDVADSSLDVVGDPLHEVGRVLVLDVKQLLIHLLHGHPAPEHTGHGEVSAVSGVAGCHHVASIEHLLGQLGNGERPVLLRTTGGEWSKPGHEEVETREGNHVDSQLPQVSIELAGKPQTGGHS